MQPTNPNEKQVEQIKKQNRQQTTITTKERSSEGNREVTQRHIEADVGVKKENNITIMFDKEVKLKRPTNMKVGKENITIKPSVPLQIVSKASKRPANKSNPKSKKEMDKSSRSNDMPVNVLNTQKIEKETKHTVNQRILDIKKNQSKPKLKDNQHLRKKIGKTDGGLISFKPQEINLKTHLII